MKREPLKKTDRDRKLVLRRDSIRALDDDALHQARGGAGIHASDAMMREA